jgi:thioredoxin reductase (NADPH)
MSQYLVSRLEHAPNIRIHTDCTICAVHGGDRLEAATILHARGGQRQVRARGLFVMIGADPGTTWLRNTIALDANGFVLTGADAAVGAGPVPLPFETSQPGVFAIGDVRSGSVKRVASAVGEGSVAVQAIHRYLTESQIAERVALSV